MPFFLKSIISPFILCGASAELPSACESFTIDTVIENESTHSDSESDSCTQHCCGLKHVCCTKPAMLIV